MALTPDERHAINDLFARLQANGPADKDPEADALINQNMRRTPDSAYILVQTTLVQQAHIEDLEARIGELENQLANDRRPAAGGGFLGGARRGAAPAPRDDYADDRRYGDERYGDDRRSGIPPIGSRSGPSAYDPAPEPARAPAWGGARPQGPQGGAGAPPPQAQSGGGGFFRTAAAMAAGVAGGSLLANSLGGMFGGQKSGEAQAGQSAQDSATSNQSDHHQAHDNDPGSYDDDDHYDAADDGDWDGGGDDLEI